MPQIDLSILNQRQTPAFYADVLANRPAAGFIGRIFVSTDTYEFYRDNGTTWDIVGGPGSGTVTGSGSLFRVAIWNSTSSIGESNNLIFDYSTNRLGIGTNTPGASLDVHSAASSIAQFNQTTATNNSLLVLQNSGSALWRLGNYYNAGANDFGVFDVIGAQQPLTIKKTTGQVLIGTSTVGSGKLVVSSSTSDNGIQIAGANAPSLRIDNAESGPTKRAGLGISTAVNNFIQGSVDGDICFFSGSTTPSPILFGIYGTTNVQEAARISAARNFLVGSTVDAGFKADINGTARIQDNLTISNNRNNDTQIIISNTTSNTASKSQIGTTSSGGSMFMQKTSALFTTYKIINGGDGGLYNTSGDLYFLTEGAGNIKFAAGASSTVQARIFSTGNFGINQNTDAGFKLAVNGGTQVDGDFQLGYTGVNTRNINFSQQFSPTIVDARIRAVTNSGLKLNIEGVASELDIVSILSSRPASLTSRDSILRLDTTTKAFLPPRMTTVQKNAIRENNGTPNAGCLVYDTTLNKLSVFTGVNWETVTSV